MSIFNYYPYVYYNNIKSTHILLKEKIIQEYTKDYTKFYSYTVKDGERADIVAYNEYGDPSLDWVIYVINDVIDPYKDWIMDTDSFISYLQSKYNVAVEKLGSPLIPSSIDHYYYGGIATDDPETIASYNYTMTPFTYEKLGSPAGWVPKTIYDVEYEKNEAKRDIKLLYPYFVDSFKQQFKDLMLNG